MTLQFLSIATNGDMILGHYLTFMHFVSLKKVLCEKYFLGELEEILKHSENYPGMVSISMGAPSVSI